MKPVLFLTAALVLTTQILIGGEQLRVIEEHVNGRLVPMVAGRVIARTRSAVSVEELKASLPSGFRVLAPTFPIDRDTEDRLRPRSEEGPRERLSRVYTVAYDGPVSPLQAVSILKAKCGTVCDVVEPWYAAYPQGQPNDPLLGQQTYLDVIKLKEAWNVAWGDQVMVIMINDNGVDQSHDDITGNIAVNADEVPNNGIDDDGNGFIDDHLGYNFSWQEDGTVPDDTRNPFDSHGLEVAGLAAAHWNNGTGIAGTGGACRLFPIKTSPSASGGLIIYGYQGIVYAALNHASIVNCSWGVVKPFSAIDQDVIDFALESGTVVVGSAGNDGNELTNYPAAYRGVFGVGETTVNDIVTGSSSYGINADVFAPGRNALTTTSGNTYTSSGITGTSFAAPIGAGVIGLIRSQHAFLEPLQVVAFARQCVDDISQLNPQYGRLLAGRLNALKAVTMQPFATLGVLIKDLELRTSTGARATRIQVGDTVFAHFTILNALRSTTDLAAFLSVARGSGWTIEILDPDVSIGACATNARRTITPIRIVINGTSNSPLQLRMDFTSGNDECFDLWYVDKPSGMTTMANQAIRYSIGDRGQFGYSDQSDSRVGDGFQWRPYQLMNYGSGIMLCDSLGRVLSSVYRPGDVSDFTSEKSFTGADSVRGILSDKGQVPPFALGVELEQRTNFPQADAPVATIVVTVRNTGTTDLRGVTCGYFIDWDVGENGSDNRVESAPYALPPVMNPLSLGAAEATWREGYKVATVVVAYSSTPGVTPQAAGAMFNALLLDGDGLTDAERIELMSSGTSMQTDESGDAVICVGMRFNGSLAPNSERSFTLVIAADSTKEAAADLARRYVLDPTSVDSEEDDRVVLYPQPVHDVLYIDGASTFESVQIVDMMGRMVRFFTGGAVTMPLDLTGMPSGSYVVRLMRADTTAQHSLITVVR
jgi:hypothetical protein